MDLPEAAPVDDAPTAVDAEVAVEAVAEDDEGGIGDDVDVVPEAPNGAPRRRKRRGLRLSWLLNAITLGLGGWALFRGWTEHVEKRSVEFLSGLAAGLWTGLSFMRRYKQNKRLKHRKGRILDFRYGPRELKILAGEAPYWVDFSRIEQLSSVNSLIRQTWSFYEAAICKQIAETVEPLMMQYKPIFVSAIKFKKLTFGDAPFKATHISVIKEEFDELVLEMGVRWDGAAHVAIGIDIIGAGFITPAVKRLNFFANVRIALTRMVPRMPGFGAMLISFKSPPLVTFDLDCGPGIGELIEAWLIPFLKNDILGNMLVWPNRIVIPLMPPDVLGPLDNLQLHTRGVLKVTVVEARGLPKADIAGKGDPFAILETVALKPVKTKVIHNTDTPQWNETLFLKVQEVDQCLRVTVRDQESAIVGALTMNSSDLQGRTLVSLEDLEMGETEDKWYPLGKGDWGALDGPGTGSGEIHLQLCYYTLDALRSGAAFPQKDADTTPRGLVFVTIEEGSNLLSIDLAGGLSDPYCVIFLGGVRKTTKVLKNTRDPVWHESVDWSNVSALESMFVEVHDKGKLSDRLLGKVQMPMLPIAKEFSQGTMQSPLQVTLDLEGDKGAVTLLVEWVPLDNHPIPVNKQTLRNIRSLIGTSDRGVLFVHLVSGEDLKNVDTFSLSDPYVILQIGANPKVSKFIKNNLNPVWKQTFSWNNVRESAVLHGEVKDKGTVRDKTLGVFKIPISPLLDPEGEVHPFTLPLKDKETGNSAQGRINLQMCWRLWKREANAPEPEEPKWPAFSDVGSGPSESKEES